MTQDKILILDFGSQVTQLIARRVREAHVYCELYSFDMPLADIKAFNPKAIIGMLGLSEKRGYSILAIFYVNNGMAGVVVRIFEDNIQTATQLIVEAV